MNEKVIKMFIHCLKELHILENFNYKVKTKNTTDIINLITEHNNINYNLCKITSHIFTWDYQYQLEYCVTQYKLCYFIHSVLNIDIDKEVLANLVGRSYTSAKNEELNNFVKYFQDIYNAH